MRVIITLKKHQQTVGLCILINIIVIFSFAHNVVVKGSNHKDTLVVAIDREYAPHEFVDPDTGEVRGFNVDIIKEVASLMDVDIIWRPMVWKDAYESLKNNSVDLLSMSAKKERREYFLFSRPILDLTLSIFVRSQESGVATIDDLINHTVAVEEEDISQVVLNETVPGAIIVPVESQLEALKLLAAGEVTAFFGNTYTARYLIIKNRITGLKEIGERTQIASRSLAVNKQNLALIEKINASLDTMFSNGKYDQIYTKWFGSEITFQYENISWLIGLLLTMMAVVIIIILITMVNIQILRKKVKEKTKELSDSETRYRILAEESPLGIFITNKEGYVLYSNSVIGKKYQNKPIDFFFNDFLNKEDIPQIKKMFKLMFDENTHYELELKSKYKTNQSFHTSYWSVNCNAITYLNQPALLCVFTDITDRKITELMKETFFSTITHELRTPLTVINGYISFLLSNPNLDYDKKEKILNTIKKNISRLNFFISQINELTKLEKKKLSLIYQEVTFGTMIDSLKEALPIVYPNRKIILDSNIDNQELLMIDVNRFHQIIYNLVDNAIKHSDSSTTVYLTFERQANDLITKITDEGIGIKKEHFKKIFEPYVTIPSKYSHIGTGLGLFIVKSLVEAFNGEIKLESEINKGTTFTVILRDIFIDKNNNSS